MVPRRRRSSVVAAASACLTICAVGLASADPGSGRSFVDDTNGARADSGLAAYSTQSDLAGVAQQWAQWMAEHRTLAHNPSLPSVVCCWHDLGENVGRGPSESAIQRAFMASPDHRANILSGAYTQIGIGTALSRDGRLYVDEVFRRPMSSPARTSPRVSRGDVRSPQVGTSLTRAQMLDRWRSVWRRRARQVASADAVRRCALFETAMRTLMRRR